MLDSDICIHFMRDRKSVVKERFKAESGRISLSAIALQELIYGAERSARAPHHLELVEDLKSRLEVLPFDEAASDHAGRIRAELARLGTPIGPYDALIAGHARSLGLTVITGNLREFQRVDGLRCEDWTAK